MILVCARPVPDSWERFPVRVRSIRRSVSPPWRALPARAPPDCSRPASRRPAACGGLPVDRVGGERGDGSVTVQGAFLDDGELGDLAVLAELERGRADGNWLAVGA